jgi:hypothetical protein
MLFFPNFKSKEKTHPAVDALSPEIKNRDYSFEIAARIPRPAAITSSKKILDFIPRPPV